MRRYPATHVRAVAHVLLLLLVLAGLAVAAYQTGTGRWHATPVLSGSMRPGLQPGDVVLTERVPVSDLRVRDVVVFHPAGEGDRLRVHRIVKMTSRNGSMVIATRGDANSADDPEDSSLSGPDTYRVERVIPVVGYPAVWLSARSHGTLAIALGALLLIVAAATALRKNPTDVSVESAPEEEGRAGDRQGSALSA